MHECPECSHVCYCDLDDSNDCRDHGICYHDCPPQERDLEYGAEDEDSFAADAMDAPEMAAARASGLPSSAADPETKR